MRLRALAVAVLTLAVSVPRPSLDAQVRAVYDRGAAGLTQQLLRLRTTASVLHVGAHPDDEDSAFIARAARGDHARTAYLALTRGEGGQNIIGPELFDALGVIRTEELLQARRLDGGEQFFTRAYDFGFSKTRAETASKWNEEAVLEDMVRVIRTFRPLVIYSRFTGTQADGHGHHQMAGYLTPVAFRAAADPQRFPALTTDALRPWQPKKLYVGGRGGGGGPLLQVATGAWDPALGRSYAEIAAEGRSQHKSQEMGTIEPLGPSSTSLRMAENQVATQTTTAAPEQSVFDNLDVSLRGIARLTGLPDGTISTELASMDEAVSRAIREYRPGDPAAVVPLLANGLRATRAARSTLRTLGASPAAGEADFLLAQKEREFSAALVSFLGIVVDPLADRETVEAGGTIDVSVRTFAASSLSRPPDVTLRTPDGWRATRLPDAGADAPGPRRETPAHVARFQISAPATATPTQPYFLASPRVGPMYPAATGADLTKPFQASLLETSVQFVIDGIEVTVAEPVLYRYADPVRGELRRDVNVVPAVALGFESSLLVVPTGSTANRQRVSLHVTSLRREAVNGTIALALPAGWTATPASVAFTLGAANERRLVSFDVTAPAARRPGAYPIAARATIGNATYSHDMQLIAYPHIQTHRLYTDAAATAQVLNLAVTPVHVGYIMGSGDSVPDALRRMNLRVTLLDDATLTAGDLAAYDAIVVGVRASEARPAFAANQARLRQFMERGGTLIVQYQQGEYTAQNLPPYPAQIMGNSRVTDETARITILAPQHAAFTFPNRITAADFDGWVQERNLYAFTSFDPRYTPLLEASDPGEMPQRGGEVYARVGRGHFVYTSYAWFRQLPAGVPGAYRLMANLVSLSKAAAPAGSPTRGNAARSGGAPVEAPDRTRPSR